MAESAPKKRGRPPKAVTGEPPKKRGRPPKKVDAPASAPRPTTGAVLMKLRALVTEKAGQPWHTIAMLNPVFSDEPYSDFVVKARCPGENVWVGQWPCDVTDLESIVAELLAVRESGVQATLPEVDEDGNVISDPKVVGKAVTLTLANGEVVTVTPRKMAPKESEKDEEARLQRELKASPQVRVKVGEATFVSWNGQDYWLQPGYNDVPQPIADILTGAAEDDMPPLDIDARRARGLSPTPSYEEMNGILARQRRGG